MKKILEQQKELERRFIELESENIKLKLEAKIWELNKEIEKYRKLIKDNIKVSQRLVEAKIIENADSYLVNNQKLEDKIKKIEEEIESLKKEIAKEEEIKLLVEQKNK